MGDVDDAHLKPDELRAHARQLVEDADIYEKLIKGAQEGLRTASTDAAPWFSAGGWGMFKQPAAAANDADRYITEVRELMETRAKDLRTVTESLTSLDFNNSADLDKVVKVVYPDE